MYYKIKIPNKLKVGGHQYLVEYVKSRDVEKGNSNWGITHLSEKKIQLDKELKGTSTIEEVFVHELLHTALHETKLNYDLEDKKEEEFVNRLGASLYQILKDNKLWVKK